MSAGLDKETREVILADTRAQLGPSAEHLTDAQVWAVVERSAALQGGEPPAPPAVQRSTTNTRLPPFRFRVGVRWGHAPGRRGAHRRRIRGT